MPAFAAAVLMGVPYAHYAVSRNDLEHVAVSILPIVIAACTMPWRRGPIVRTLVLGGLPRCMGHVRPRFSLQLKT